MSQCPECDSRVTWRNTAVRCLDCGRRYCKECPDYRWGRFRVRCPDCGCREARTLRNSGGEAARPSSSSGPSGSRGGGAGSGGEGASAEPTPFVFG